MFVDEIILKINAGSGGNGCTSFRREKFVPMGGPDGGNGGKGSNIIFKVDEGLKTLIDLRYLKVINGKKGENGKGSNMYGSNAEDIIIKVPIGTTIIDNETNEIIADLIKKDEEVIVAKGGIGGKGNKTLATHDNPAPKFSENGEPGESKIIKCELKLLADVGLIGFPSVGKSTLLSQISACKPKIAAYHFTTLAPNLGVVKLKNHQTFIIADLPGLIEGASEGIGLGDKFLKHAMRTKILCHVLDMSGSEERSPIDDYKIIRNEIEKYNENLAKKDEIIIANKMDLPKANDNLKTFKKQFKHKKIFPISALNNQGINELLEFIGNKLSNINVNETDKLDSHIIYKFSEERPFIIKKNNNIWELKGKKIEKLFKMTKFDEEEAVKRFARQLKNLGVDDELERLGAKKGDEIKIFDYIFEFKE